jgi:hypothetical protein
LGDVSFVEIRDYLGVDDQTLRDDEVGHEDSDEFAFVEDLVGLCCSQCTPRFRSSMTSARSYRFSSKPGRRVLSTVIAAPITISLISTLSAFIGGWGLGICDDLRYLRLRKV